MPGKKNVVSVKKVETPKTEEPDLSTEKGCLDIITKRLKECGGESNIGVTDIYWDALKEYRKFRNG